MLRSDGRGNVFALLENEVVPIGTHGGLPRNGFHGDVVAFAGSDVVPDTGSHGAITGSYGVTASHGITVTGSHHVDVTGFHGDGACITACHAADDTDSHVATDTDLQDCCNFS